MNAARVLVGQAAKGDLPHLIFHGPPGSGKKTRVMALLREVFGSGVSKARLPPRPVARLSHPAGFCAKTAAAAEAAALCVAALLGCRSRWSI